MMTHNIMCSVSWGEMYKQAGGCNLKLRGRPSCTWAWLTRHCTRSWHAFASAQSSSFM